MNCLTREVRAKLRIPEPVSFFGEFCNLLLDELKLDVRRTAVDLDFMRASRELLQEPGPSHHEKLTGQVPARQ